MTLRFGTDGVRGLANAELTPELVLALGRAAARVLGGDHVLIGRDTRRSGPMLESALAAGFASEGVHVQRLGVLPTPGVAWLAAARGVPAAVVSASHNPAQDNGVKLFAAGGRKLPAPVEAELEAALEALLADGTTPADAPVGADVGEVVGPGADPARYVEWLGGILEEGALEGLSVVVDCANGAAARIAPEVLRRAGARVDVLGTSPDGLNINDGCGSTSPAALQSAVVATGADVGLALDGDADRVLAVDHEGRIVDGDHLIALCAIDLLDRGQLTGGTVVVTVMTNLGFRLAMAERGIDVVETPVGDRHVLEALAAGGWSLGGEQSGHIVFADLATTGDGVLTGLRVLDVVRRQRRPLSELAAAAMTRLPQVLRSVAVDVPASDVVEAVAAEVAEVEAELGERGRVVLRPSGTEPLVRVMVEGPTDEAATAGAERLVAAVRRAAEGLR